MNLGLAARSALLLAIASLAISRVASAQGPAPIQFESVSTSPVECALPNCSGVLERRRSRLGHSVLMGALVGASAGLLIATLAYGACGIDDSADARPCGETAGIAFGVSVGAGTLIGLLVGASEPSRGPVPTD